MISGTLGQRLIHLRKDLGNRLGEDLSVNDVAQKMGIERYTLDRLESKSRGSMDSLVTVLRFYRTQGYNQEWILADNNDNTPMVVPSRPAMMQVVKTLNKLKECVTQYTDELEEQLKNIGFNPPKSQPFPKESGTDFVLPPEEL